MAKIYYLIPDLFRPKFNLKDFLLHIKRRQLLKYVNTKMFPKHKPIGGIKVMYQHCIMLKQMGFDVQPLIMGKYKGNFFGYDLDYAYISDIGFDLKPEDIVVGTEFRPYQALSFVHARKILFMQNWFFIDKTLNKEDQGKSYLDIGYDEVITCGDFCTEMVEKMMGIPAATITNGIDQSIFIAKPEKRISGRVLVMSRKNYSDFEKIKALCSNDVDFRVVDGLTQEQLINEYQQADIFLATGYPEGLPLPPLEAMNCGCVVVGFTGGGASEYMIDGVTALVADDGDCKKAAQHIDTLLVDTILKEELRVAGQKTAKSYSLLNMSRKLEVFFEKLT